MLTEEELAQLQDRCRTIPITSSGYMATDFVTAMFDTVLDYQNRAETLRKADDHFKQHRWDEVRTVEDLEAVMARFPDDDDGNRELATHLWGNRHWRRAQELRGLAAYFRDRDVTDLDSLERWATDSRPEDFIGHIKGLGPTIYRGLVMRVGVDTIKPDVHVLRFVSAAIGRHVSEDEAVTGLEEVAGRLRIPARTLDWSIWEYQSGGGAG